VRDELSADRSRRTKLHYAALAGQLAVVQSCIGDGADLNAQDLQGFTPLHFAAQKYQLDVAEALLAAGASVDVRNVHGNTALWIATFNSRGRGELISQLLAHGADPDSVNDSGASPRTLASMIANFDIAQFFSDVT
jgi:uncharacterized protein